jgi:hypothetical protein
MPRTGGVAQVVEYLLCKLKAVSLNSSPTKKKKKKKKPWLSIKKTNSSYILVLKYQ